jgi:hypothetical protein
MYLEVPDRRPPWMHNALVRVLLIEAPWSRNSCHSACLAWASSSGVCGAPERCNSCSGCATATSGAGGAARDTDASVSCAATSCSHPPASPIPRARARGLAQIAPSIGPSRGQNHHQQGPPLPCGFWWPGSPNEPARALGEGRGGPMPARPLSPPLLAAALRPRS